MNMWFKQYVNTMNFKDEHDINYLASFEKRGCLGNTCKVHKGQKFDKLERRPAMVRTFLRPQISTKLLCDRALKKVSTLKEIIQAFNKEFSHRCVRIRVNSVVKALIDCNHDEWCLIEDRCQQPFMNFLDRHGKPEAAIFQLLQTLVHFSYHYTSGRLIIAGLKGCKDSKSFTLSIPTIHSVSGDFGQKDEGLIGIDKCLNLHKCNKDCEAFIKNNPRRRTPSAPYQPEELGLKMKDTFYDDIVARSRAASSPVDCNLYLKDKEEMPPPYSPIDPNKLPDGFHYLTQMHGGSYFSYNVPQSDTEPKKFQNHNDITSNDDVFR